VRRAAKVDANHSAIVKSIREAGFSVHDTSAVGRGFPDLVCGYGGRTFLVEVKCGTNIPSKRRLTAPQETFKASWLGCYVVIESVDQAQSWCETIKLKRVYI